MAKIEKTVAVRHRNWDQPGKSLRWPSVKLNEGESPAQKPPEPGWIVPGPEVPGLCWEGTSGGFFQTLD